MTPMMPEPFVAMRHAMVVSQLRPSGVNDVRVIDAMSKVPREAYVPDERRTTAYADRIIPVAGGRGINPPTVTGLLLNAAQIATGDRVLIIGSASGYTAAVVAMLTELVAVAEPGAPIDDRYDVIVIDGAVEALPETIVERLAPGGRLVTGVVEQGVTRLAIGRRSANGFGLQPFLDAEMVVLPAFARPPAFSF